MSTLNENIESIGNIEGFDEAAFDFEAAKRSIDEIIAIPDQIEDPDAEGVFTRREAAILATQLPVECLIPSEVNPGGFYAPAAVLDYAATRLFGERWNTEVLDKPEILFNEAISMHFDGKTSSPSEKRVYRVIAQARVRVSVVGPRGKQSHDGVGISSWDVPNGGDYAGAFRVAVKGAATDARRDALGHFGILFSAKGWSKDLVLESMRQRSRAAAAMAELATARAAKPAEPAPVKAASAPAKPVQHRQKARAIRSMPARGIAVGPGTVNPRPAASGLEESKESRAPTPAQAVAPANAVFRLLNHQGVEIETYPSPIGFLEALIELVAGIDDTGDLKGLENQNNPGLAACEALRSSKEIAALLAAVNAAFDGKSVELLGFGPPPATSLAPVPETGGPAGAIANTDADAARPKALPDLDIARDVEGRLSAPEDFAKSFSEAISQFGDPADVDRLIAAHASDLRALKPTSLRMQIFEDATRRKMELAETNLAA